MGALSKIEWCDSTFNPWRGCTKISPACDNCYAEALVDTRLHQAKWGPGQPRVRTSEKSWKRVEQWNRVEFYECDCGYRGTFEDLTTNALHRCDLSFRLTRRRVFCASLADVFDNEVDPGWRRALFDLIAATPNLDWLLLTKRIGNVPAMLPDDRQGARYSWGNGWSNVWIGATICNQDEADRDIPKLLALPAFVRFVSIEPMLGPINLKLMARAHGFPKHITSDGRAVGMPQGLHWVIAGGESGPHARPSHPDWFRSIRDQCAAAGLPFLFKQWGEFAPNWLNDETGNKVPGSEWIDRIGKKHAGRHLDGRTHNQFPRVGVAA